MTEQRRALLRRKLRFHLDAASAYAEEVGDTADQARIDGTRNAIHIAHQDDPNPAGCCR